MIATRTEAASGGADPHLESALAASGWLSVRAAELPAVRSEVAKAYAKTLSSGVLKQADEQGLVALLAMRRALDEARLGLDEIEGWGLVASARMPGRRRIADSLIKFREQGAWSTSPHVIPHCSLHSLSGLLSQGLQLHGPNIGTGGMIGSEREAIWTALAMLHGERLPGVWVVLTGWDQESLDATPLSCQAALLGVQQATGRSARPTLRFTMLNAATEGPALTLESLGRALRGQTTSVWGLGEATVTLSFTNTCLEAAA